MSIKFKRFYIIGLILTLVMLLASCGVSKTTSDKNSSDQKVSHDWPSQMTAVVGAQGGSGYSLMSTWVPVMNSKLGINISVRSTAGLSLNTQLVNAGEAEFGLSSGGLAEEAWSGTAEWAKNQKLQDFRVVAVLQPYVTQFWGLKKTGITSIEDFNGKHLSLNRVGTGAQTWGERYMDFFKIKPAKIDNVSPGQTNNMIKDGLLDMGTVHGSVPHNAIVQLSANNDVTVVGLGKENSAEFVKKYPALYQYTIPAGTYKGQTDPIYTVAEPVLLIVNKNVPDDLVYAITKATFDNIEKLSAGYKQFSKVTKENIKFSPVPLHPGAYRFYKEAGIQVPDNIKP